MKTLSAKEFQQLYGSQGLEQVKKAASTPTTTTTPKMDTPDEPNYFQRLGANYKEAGADVMKQLDDAGTGKTEAPIAALHSVGTIAKTAFAPITEAVGPLLKRAIDKISDTKGIQKSVASGPGADVLKVADTIKAFGEKHPELARSADDLYNIANLLAGAKGDANVTDIVKNSKTKITGMLERAPEVPPSGTGTSGIPKETGNNFVSRKLYESAIGRTADEAEKILNFRAKKALGEDAVAPVTRATTAQKYGLAGRQTEIGVQAKTKGKLLYRDAILPELQKSKEVITKEDLFNPLKEKIDETVDPSRKVDLQDAYDALTEEYANESTWSLEKAQELKRGIDKFTPDKVFRGKPIASTYNELRHDLADTIRRHTYEKLSDVNIKQKYLDYGNLLELQKVGIRGLTNNQLKGGAGSFVSGLVEKLVTPIATYGGKVLYRVPKTKINFIAEPGMKTVGDFFKSRGYDTDL